MALPGTASLAIADLDRPPEAVILWNGYRALPIQVKVIPGIPMTAQAQRILAPPASTWQCGSGLFLAYFCVAASQRLHQFAV